MAWPFNPFNVTTATSAEVFLRKFRQKIFNLYFGGGLNHSGQVRDITGRLGRPSGGQQQRATSSQEGEGEKYFFKAGRGEAQPRQSRLSRMHSAHSQDEREDRCNPIHLRTDPVGHGSCGPICVLFGVGQQLIFGRGISELTENLNQPEPEKGESDFAPNCN